MGYEIDMIAVGDGAKGGDAIAIRYGDLLSNPPRQTVVVIDGGTEKAAHRLVEIVGAYYHTSIVDILISSHPDCDHTAGLKIVLEQLTVRQVVMHRPWEYAATLKNLFANRSLTVPGLRRSLRVALDNVCEIEGIAKQKRIPIIEPFAGVGTSGGELMILGPSPEYYASLVCQFEHTPEPRTRETLLTGLLSTLGEAASAVRESLDRETLTDDGVTSPSNNSSVITLIRDSGHSLLFTGDAGIDALNRAATFAAANGIALRPLDFLQVPHHGSRRNLGPTVLERLVPKLAHISAAPLGHPKHPSQRVINAILRRQRRDFGLEAVYATRGRDLHQGYNAPARAGWVPAEPLAHSDVVEPIGD